MADKEFDGLDTELESLKSQVRKLEEQIDALHEAQEENHHEVMEFLRDMIDSGTGFSTFES